MTFSLYKKGDAVTVNKYCTGYKFHGDTVFVILKLGKTGLNKPYYQLYSFECPEQLPLVFDFDLLPYE